MKIQGTRITPKEDKSEYIYILSYIATGLGEKDFMVYDEGTKGYGGVHNDRCAYYYTDIPNLGKLTITYLNESERIISGTFYMNLVNDRCEGDTLMKVTDGRFDFRY